MLNPRLATLPEYPFDRLRQLLDGVAPPAGVEEIVLSIGEPRHPPPAFVSDVMAEHRDTLGRYPPIDGSEAFRDAVGDWLQRRYGLEAVVFDRHRQILPVVGTREALYLVSALVVPERKGGGRPIVAMPNPFYHVYGGAAAISGSEPMFLAATAENRFIPDVSTLEPAVLDRLALYYLCSPANPQGMAADRETLARAIEAARRHDFVLVVDECYAEIYLDAPPPGALEVAAAMGEGFANVLVFHSLSKRSSAAGLRSGFVAGDADLIAAFRRLRNYVGPQMPLPVVAASAALWNEEDHVTELRALYRANFDTAAQVLGDRFGYFRPDGGFFLWLDVGDGVAAAERLWREGGLRVLPGAYIARPDGTGGNPGERYIRLALVNPPAVTREALERLVKVL